MINRPLRIAVYADQKSRVEFSHPDNSSIIRELRRVFGAQMHLMLVNADAVRSGSLFLLKPDVFILPGIIGEKSLYHDHIGVEGNMYIRRFVESGGLFMGFCAGAYYASSRILYQPDWDAPRERVLNNLSLFNGIASGPVKNKGRKTFETPVDDAEEIYHIDPVSVTICDGAMAGESFEMAYGLGPMFVNAGDDVKVLARYAHVEGQPAAIIDMQIGAGHAILSGVLPQFGHESDPAEFANGISKPLARLLTALYQHRDSRRAFWDGLMQRAASHIKPDMIPRHRFAS